MAALTPLLFFRRAPSPLAGRARQDLARTPRTCDLHLALATWVLAPGGTDSPTRCMAGARPCGTLAYRRAPWTQTGRRR